MTQVPVNPVASTVSTFAPGEVREDRRTDFQQLAAGLAAFAPALGRFAAFANRREQEEQFAAAQTELNALQIQNEEQFKAAVERGDIDENDNPHKITFMRRLARQSGIRLAAENFRVAYDQDQALQNATPQEVYAAFLAAITPSLEGAKPRETSEAMAVVQDLRQKFVTNHTNGLRRRVEARTRAELESDLGSTLSSYGFDEATPIIQGRIDEAVRVMDPLKVEAAVVAAATARARAAKDPELLSEILNSVSIDGETLLTGREDLVSLESERIDRALSEEENRRFAREQRENQERVQQDLDTLTRVAQENDINKLTVTYDSIDQLGLSTRQQNDLRIAFERSIQDVTRRSFAEITQDGSVTPQEQISFQQVMVLAGRGPNEAAEMIKNFRESGSVAPTALEEAQALLEVSGSRESQLQELGDLYANGVLSENTFNQQVRLIVQSDFDDGRAAHYRLSEATSRLLPALLAQKAQLDGLFEEDAQQFVNERMAEWTITSQEILGNPNLSPDEKTAKIEEARDAFYEDLGANTDTNFEELLVRENALSVATVQTADGGSLEVNRVVTPEEVEGNFEFSEGQFFYVGPGAKDGKERVSGASVPLMFSDIDQFSLDPHVDSVLLSLGMVLTDLDSAKAVLLRQATIFDRLNGVSTEDGARRSAYRRVMNQILGLGRGADTTSEDPLQRTTAPDPSTRSRRPGDPDNIGL